MKHHIKCNSNGVTFSPILKILKCLLTLTRFNVLYSRLMGKRGLIFVFGLGQRKECEGSFNSLKLQCV